MDDPFLVQVGSARRDDGDRMLTFVRVIHRPSGKERQVIGIGDQTVQAVVTRLCGEIVQELEQEGFCEPVDRP